MLARLWGRSHLLTARRQARPCPPTLRKGCIAKSMDADADDAICSILDVKMDNSKSPKYTLLEIEVQEYPALLRTVAWTLNGLGVKVQNGFLRRDDDGFSSQSYWLTDLDGNKLTDITAYNVQESLTDIIKTCNPLKAEEQKVWDNGNVFISNLAHPKFTVLIIKGEPKKVGFLLEIATVATAIGAVVHEARIQGDKDVPECCAEVEGHDFVNNGRIFKFLLAEENGTKLSPGRVATVLYTLDLVAGKGHQPLSLK